MTFLLTALVTAAALALACGGGGRDNRSAIDSNQPTKSTNAAPTSQPAQTALIGCLQAGDRAGSYVLQVAGDTADRVGVGTSGASATGQGRAPGSSTTGVGGDAIRNSPTIGGGMAARTYRVVIADANSTDVGENVGKQVSIVGVVEDSATTSGAGDASRNAEGAPTANATPVTSASGAEPHTIRASSVTKIADSCTSAR